MGFRNNLVALISTVKIALVFGLGAFISRPTPAASNPLPPPFACELYFARSVDPINISPELSATIWHWATHYRFKDESGHWAYPAPSTESHLAVEFFSNILDQNEIGKNAIRTEGVLVGERPSDKKRILALAVSGGNFGLAFARIFPLLARQNFSWSDLPFDEVVVVSHDVEVDEHDLPAPFQTHPHCVEPRLFAYAIQNLNPESLSLEVYHRKTHETLEPCACCQSNIARIIFASWADQHPIQKEYVIWKRSQ